MLAIKADTTVIDYPATRDLKARLRRGRQRARHYRPAAGWVPGEAARHFRQGRVDPNSRNGCRRPQVDGREEEALPRRPRRHKNPEDNAAFDKAAAAERVKTDLADPEEDLSRRHASPCTSRNPLELLIATILSAQCTDVRVNMVTPGPVQEVQVGRRTGPGRTSRRSSRTSRAAASITTRPSASRGPARRSSTTSAAKSPGRWTSWSPCPASAERPPTVVLGNAFGQPGHRLRHARHPAVPPARSYRRTCDDPVKLEFDLADIVPKEDWTLFSHLLIFHGRTICKARKPDCPACPIAEALPGGEQA